MLGRRDAGHAACWLNLGLAGSPGTPDDTSLTARLGSGFQRRWIRPREWMDVSGPSWPEPVIKIGTK